MQLYNQIKVVFVRLKAKSLRRSRRVLRSRFVTSQDLHIWQTWANRLKGWGLQDFAASFLEAAGPINLIGAQLVYVAQPLLGSVLPSEHLDSLASMLEEPGQTKAFISYLREVEE